MDAFLIKKLISVFIHLIPGLFLLLMLGLLIRSRWPKCSLVLLWSGLSLLVALSSPAVSNRLVATLENKYPALSAAPDDTALVLVLADGHIWAPDRPTNTVLKAIGLSRLTEGIRLWKTQPQSVLATSGEKFRSPVEHSLVMNRFALQQGVSAEQTVQFPTTRDTHDEIVDAIAYLESQGSPSNRRIVVVSSAVHLPRIALMLDHYGATYTMAPTDYIAVTAPWYRFHGYYLNNADRVLHEYVGMLWFKLRNR